MVSGTISLPSSGCFSPFPHGTRALSVSREYLALPDGPGGFTQDSSCPALLRIPLRSALPPGTGLSPPLAGLSRPFPPAGRTDGAVLLPRGRITTRRGLGYSPFARHYWGNHCCFLFLEVLRCFSSLRSPPRHCAADDRPSGGRVVPFGYPGVDGHLRLARAFRSLSRPSSPP